MANEIIDKLFVIVEESKKNSYSSAIRFADVISKQEREEFSYIRSNQIQYCEWQTVREYIYFARDINLLENDLKPSPDADYSTFVGFKSWVGDALLEYIEENGYSIANLKKGAKELLDNKTLPTTEYLFQNLSPDNSEKHFRWSLSLLESIKPLTIGVCRKWIWVPANTFEF